MKNVTSFFETLKTMIKGEFDTSDLIHTDGEFFDPKSYYPDWSQLSENAKVEVLNLLSMQKNNYESMLIYIENQIVEINVNTFSVFSNEILNKNPEIHIAIEKFDEFTTWYFDAIDLFIATDNIIDNREITQKHPFIGIKYYHFFNKFLEEIDSIKKADFTLLYDFLKEHHQKQLTERAFFEFVIKQTEIPMALRRQPKASNPQISDKIEDLYSKFIESYQTN